MADNPPDDTKYLIEDTPLHKINVNILDLRDYKYDYILFGCAYIHRLEARKKDIIQKTQYDELVGEHIIKTHDLVYFIYFSSNFVSRIQRCDDMVYRSSLEAQKVGITLKDSVCIRVTNHCSALIENLKSYRHCAFFDEPRRVVSFNTFTGKRVLYLEYDTESE